LAALGESGIDSLEFGESAGRSWPLFRVVVEGQAREAQGAPDAVAVQGEPLAPRGPGFVEVVRAPGSGDDAIVEEVARPFDGETVVVTADRELVERVEAFGAAVRGPRWLLGQLDALA
ncbi:MAG: NTP pyrophosphohydrolase, partial [Herbiconiux sp.]|nr:NTP pyrophosphohydrolase [Herbiconiux sp.]